MLMDHKGNKGSTKGCLPRLDHRVDQIATARWMISWAKKHKRGSQVQFCGERQDFVNDVINYPEFRIRQTFSLRIVDL